MEKGAIRHTTDLAHDGKAWRFTGIQDQGYNPNPDKKRGDLHAKKDDVVVFGPYETRVWILFPNEQLFGVRWFELPPNTPKPLPVKIETHGEYYYSVLCEDPYDYAHADSPPRVIIP